jgi:hypothetical protein
MAAPIGEFSVDFFGHCQQFFSASARYLRRRPLPTHVALRLSIIARRVPQFFLGQNLHIINS